MSSTMVSYMSEVSLGPSLPLRGRLRKSEVAQKILRATRKSGIGFMIFLVLSSILLSRAEGPNKKTIEPLVALPSSAPNETQTETWFSEYFPEKYPTCFYGNALDVEYLSSRLASVFNEAASALQSFYSTTAFSQPFHQIHEDSHKADQQKDGQHKKKWFHHKKLLLVKESPPIEGLRLSAALFRKASSRGRTKLSSPDLIAAIEALMPTFEAFGMAIQAAAVKDVLGNVRKLKKNGALKTPIPNLVALDFEQQNATHPDSTAQAFIWLTRILKFTSRVFEELVAYPNKPFNACLTSAYEIELGPFHNVVMRSVAVALMQIIPDRDNMFACFKVPNLEALAPHLKRWNDAVKPILQKSDKIYDVQRHLYYRQLKDADKLLPPHRRILLQHNKNKSPLLWGSSSSGSSSGLLLFWRTTTAQDLSSSSSSSLSQAPPPSSSSGASSLLEEQQQEDIL